jgi:hypothetical protein
VAYLEQLAEFSGRFEWQRRLAAFEQLVDVDHTTDPYTVRSAPERDTPEFAEWWDSAIAECWWLQNHPEWSTCGWVNMGWYFQILGALVGVDILYPHRFHLRR